MRQSRQITGYIDSVLADRKLLITDRVFGETMKNIWDIALEASTNAGIRSPYVIRAIAHEAILRFLYLAENRRAADDIDKLSLVTQMYQRIWTDPTKDAKRTRWAEIKKKQANQGPPSGGDLVILSTAAKHQETASTELLTCDNDFILFDAEIRQALAVEIHSAYELPRVTRRKK